MERMGTSRTGGADAGTRTGGSRGAAHTRTGAWSGSGLWTSLVALALASVAVPTGSLRAQDPGERADTLRSCRCIGPDGEEIEGCRCVMRGEGWTMAFGEGPAGVMATPFGWQDHSDRARLGVLVSVEQDAEYESEGVYLQEVTEGSPAWEAGLRDGDVVVALAGRSVFDPLPDAEEEDAIELDRSVPVQRFLALTEELEPGEEVDIVYRRDGERRTATVVPERMRGFRLIGPQGDFRVRLDTVASGVRGPDEVRIRGLRDLDALRERGQLFEHRGPRGDIRIRGLGEGEFDVLMRGGDPCFGGGEGNVVYGLGADRCVDGVRLQALNPQLAEYFGVQEGVLVTEVLEGSSLGLRAGDVIQAIGGRTIEDAADVRRILGSYETDEAVEITVVRRGERTEVRGTRRRP